METEPQQDDLSVLLTGIAKFTMNEKEKFEVKFNKMNFVRTPSNKYHLSGKKEVSSGDEKYNVAIYVEVERL